MAVKTIDLVINTSRGEKNVRKLQQVAKQVERTFGNINKTICHNMMELL